MVFRDSSGLGLMVFRALGFFWFMAVGSLGFRVSGAMRPCVLFRGLLARRRFHKVSRSYYSVFSILASLKEGVSQHTGFSSDSRMALLASFCMGPAAKIDHIFAFVQTCCFCDCSFLSHWPLS